MEEFYVILGTPGSGRRDIVTQLMDGLPGETRVYVSRTETCDASEEALSKLEGLEVVKWFTDGVMLEIPDLEDSPDRIVFITEGARNPVDQIELLVAVTARVGRSVTRIFTIVDCSLANREPRLVDWYKACVHFSDVVVLNRREDLAASFDRDFMAPYVKECCPSLFERTKKGRLAHPDLLLSPETRRLSQAFDADRDAAYDMEFDEDNLPEDPFDLANPLDPYFRRDDRGHRMIRIPEIRDFLK